MRHALVSALLGVVLLTSLTSAGPSLTLHVLPQAFADQFGAASLDGSPPCLYAIVRDPTRWIVAAEGGGWCFDTTANATIANCANRAMGGGGSSRGNSPTMVVGGLLSTDPLVNAHYYNWSMAFLKYTDGTSGTSNRTDPVAVPADVRAKLGAAAPTQIFLRGRANLVAQLEFLRQTQGMVAPSDVILSGGSAGATAAYLSLDFVKSWLPPATRLYGAPDAGFFQDLQNIGRGTYWYRSCFEAADGVWNASGSGSLSASCLTANPGKPYLCLMQPYAAQHIVTPFFMSNSAYDMWQTLNDLGMDCVPSQNGQPVAGVAPCDAAQYATLQAFRLSQLQSMQAALAVPHTGAWVPSCFVHEMNFDYCSSQSLPNCIGFTRYNISLPAGGGQVSLSDTFFAWQTGVQARYEAVLEARRRYIAAPLQLEAQPPLPVTRFAPTEAVVQVIDALEYPGNPSCPFPTPHARPLSVG